MKPNLLTVAEESGFIQTGRIDEVDRLCAALAEVWPDAVRAFEYGRSGEGRPLRALIASRSGALTAAELRAAGTPVLMIQGGIHPGESDGKDAGFIALRELLSATTSADPGGGGARGGRPQGEEARGGHPRVGDPGSGHALARIAVLFVPAFNTDGHERVGRWNRPNQNGPEVTGWRTTAQNLNLNRDYMKADTPEMRAMLALIDTWDPLICADLHVTDGADFEPDISVQVEPVNQGDPHLKAHGLELRDRLIEWLAGRGSLPLPFYPDFVETDNPQSGFVLTVYSPRFSTGYFPQRNRFTVLVETHSWKPYAQRVQVTRNTILGLAELTARYGAAWLEQARAADRAAADLGGTELVLDYRSGWREPTASGKTPSALRTEPETVQFIDFRGYAYSRETSDISGGLVTVYDPSTPQIWHVPYRSTVEPALVVRAPRLGYFIPQAYAHEIGARLAVHGIGVSPLSPQSTTAGLEEFRAARVSFSKLPFEGRMRAALAGEWRPLSGAIATPALFVPIRQPLARLIVALLEPQAPDSFAAWGFFNAWFEQKEHLEPYVAEQVARQVLDSDAPLRAAFENKLIEDAEFRADPAARLEFICRHHSSWDQRFNCYPIYRA